MFWKYFNNLMIFQPLDFVEIIIFSLAIYYFSLWLRNDKHKNLLATFYSGLSLFFIAYFTQMNTLTNIFFIFWPVILTIFILVHQNTLQKNFVALKKIKPSEKTQFSWIEVFLRSSFNAISDNKQITAILECSDDLENYLQSNVKINAQINKELIDILINSNNFDQNKMIFINNQGIIKAINASWNIKNNNLLLNENETEFNHWQQDCMLLTSKFDAIAFRTYPKKHIIDVILQGKLISDLTPSNALVLISQLLKKNEIKVKNVEKESIEAKIKNNQYEQPSA